MLVKSNFAEFYIVLRGAHRLEAAPRGTGETEWSSMCTSASFFCVTGEKLLMRNA